MERLPILYQCHTWLHRNGCCWFDIFSLCCACVLAVEEAEGAALQLGAWPHFCCIAASHVTQALAAAASEAVQLAGATAILQGATFRYRPLPQPWWVVEKFRLGLAYAKSEAFIALRTAGAPLKRSRAQTPVLKHRIRRRCNCASDIGLAL